MPQGVFNYSLLIFNWKHATSSKTNRHAHLPHADSGIPFAGTARRRTDSGSGSTQRIDRQNARRRGRRYVYLCRSAGHHCERIVFRNDKRPACRTRG
nr:MAG TPA: hypothetical protein [Caudoviricetes sp.]